jgi:Arc/MetJ-type ribon-helix-helix transcriptional regulator
MSQSTRVSARLAHGQDETLDELVETGFYMNPSEVVREGLRKAVRDPLTFRDFEDPLVRAEWGAGDIRPRFTARVPSALRQRAERLSSDGINSAVRVAIELVADDFVEVAA